jgi:hypothetical protein
MKHLLLLTAIISFSCAFGQSLPIDFEGDVTTADMIDFDGGVSDVVANPLPAGINTSATVGMIVRNGGAIWGGSKIALSENLDFSMLTVISMKVYTTAPAGTVVKLKLEGALPFAEVDAITTTSGAWETLEFIFVGTGNHLNELVFMFDFGNTGDGSESSTFYFDDIEQIAGPPAPIPATLPLDFESGTLSSDFLNFSGATVTVVPNPQINDQNPSNTVGQMVRDGGQFWAGSQILLADDLDLSSMWHISMKVFTTAPAGTRMKLELQGPDGSTNLDYLTTTSGEWETISWNFYGQEGDFDRILFMFDFGIVGNGTATSTFLFDDVTQFEGPALAAPIPATLPVDFEESVVTTDFRNFFGAITSVIPNPQADAVNPSATVGQFVRSGGAPWAQSKLELTEFMDFPNFNFVSMKVYTDAPVGTLLKLKVESTQSGAANEKNVYTVASGEWATYSWDFSSGDPPIYNVLTPMLGYATVNDASPAATFLFDDIELTSTAVGINEVSGIEGLTCFPNPAKDRFVIATGRDAITEIAIYDVRGIEALVIQPNSQNVSIDVSGYASGLYIAKVSTATSLETIRIVVQ